MIYILDTDILSLLAHKDSPEATRIRRRIVQLTSDHSIVTTVISYEEQMRGWMAVLSRAKSDHAQAAIYQRLLQHLETFRRMAVLGYDESAANAAALLRKQTRRMGAMDLKIAAIARARNAVLVTRNLSDFRDVPGLRMEDWTTD